MATDVATVTDTVKFHLSLNVTDLARSIEFYRVLFGRDPNKVRDDYAKFEADEPGLVLSLIPSTYSPGGALNHVGIRMTDAAELVEAQRRLEMAGIMSQREEGVECCYARQTKFWVTDPDLNLWELYILHEDIDEHGAGSVPQHVALSTHAAAAATIGDAKAEVIWQHVLMQPLPERIEHADASVDEVRLEGTMNLQLEPARLQAFLQEILRVLLPGGSVMVHGLVGDRRFPSKQPTLPGPAALVQYVPQENEPAQLLAEAGFTALRFTKLGENPCYFADGVEMREMKLTAHKPTSAATEGQYAVLYKGPWSQVADESGRVYPRGERVIVPAAATATLKSRSDDFVVFSADPNATPGCSSSRAN